MSLEFYEITKAKPPSPLLVKALDYVQYRKTALDLGCGTGKDTRYLVSEGFNVVSVDKSPEIAGYLKDISADNVNIVISGFSKFAFNPEEYDVVNAQWSLPFAKKNTFYKVIEDIKISLKQGGIFTGNFFGINDEWNIPESEKTFITKEELYELFSDMEIILFEEKQYDGFLANGKPKHWHVFNLIARKSV